MICSPQSEQSVAAAVNLAVGGENDTPNHPSMLAGFKSAIQTALNTHINPMQMLKTTEISFTPSVSNGANSNIRAVEIATSAFQWKRMHMNRIPINETFTISLELPPGTHDYKFIVGGVWQCDPSKPIHMTGEHENNFIVVSEQQHDPPPQSAKHLHSLVS